jgi:hypothetical protein
MRPSASLAYSVSTPNSRPAILKDSPHIYAFTDAIAVTDHLVMRAAWPAKELKGIELGEDTVHREHRRSHAPRTQRYPGAVESHAEAGPGPVAAPKQRTRAIDGREGRTLSRQTHLNPPYRYRRPVL